MGWLDPNITGALSRMQPKSKSYYYGQASMAMRDALDQAEEQKQSALSNINSNYGLNLKSLNRGYENNRQDLMTNQTDSQNAAMKRALSSGLGGSGVTQYRQQEITDKYVPMFTRLKENYTDAKSNLSRQRSNALSQAISRFNAQEAQARQQADTMADQMYQQDLQGVNSQRNALLEALGMSGGSGGGLLSAYGGGSGSGQGIGDAGGLLRASSIVREISPKPQQPATQQPIVNQAPRQQEEKLTSTDMQIALYRDIMDRVNSGINPDNLIQSQDYINALMDVGYSPDAIMSMIDLFKKTQQSGGLTSLGIMNL